MAIEENEGTDDTTEQSSEASIPEIGTDTQTETTAGDVEGEKADMPTDEGSVQVMMTPTPVYKAMKATTGQRRPEDKPMDAIYPPQVALPNATSYSTLQHLAAHLSPLTE